MGSRVVGTMATDAVADGDQLPFSVTEQDVKRGGNPALWVLGLAGEEKAYLWMYVHAPTPDWRQVYIDGSAVEFTTTAEHYTILTAGQYGITKDETAGALSVTLEGV